LWRYLRNSNEDVFYFFNDLLNICQNMNFFSRPATQELMAQMLVMLAKERSDHETIIELMQYDWLRCGFRFLPDCIIPAEDKEQPNATRSMLYQGMPGEIAGLYEKKNRNQFFRKSYFLRISQNALFELGFKEDYSTPCVCILQTKEVGIHTLSKSLILEY
jgi:hypothetical protein